MKREIEMELHFSLVFGKCRFLLGELNDWQQRQQAGAFLIPVAEILGLRQGRQRFPQLFGKDFYKAVIFPHRKEEIQKGFFPIQKH